MMYFMYSILPAKTEKKDIKELMEDKADKTFFADESKDPFTFGNSEIYK